MQTPRASVIMAAWNASETISESIASVRAQTFREWELLVVDDGSTDDTAEIVREFAKEDDRIRVILGTHQGAANARNIGLREAVGEYAAILDSDDVATPDRLALQVAFLDAHPETSVVGGCCVVSGDTWKPPATNGAIQYLLNLLNPFVHSTVMFRRNLADSGYVESFAEDYELLARLCTKGTAANLQSVLCIRKILDTSLSATRSREQVDNAVRVSKTMLCLNLSGLQDIMVDALANACFFRHVADDIDRKLLRREYERLQKRFLEMYPDDASEIRKLGTEELMRRREFFYGRELPERLRLLSFTVKNYWRKPKTLAWFVRSVLFPKYAEHSTKGNAT